MSICVNLNFSYHTNQLGSHLNFPLIISILEKKAGRHCQKIHWPSSRPQHWALVLWRIVNWYYSDDATRRCPELGVDHLRASQISWSRIQVRHCCHIRYRETMISLRTNTGVIRSGHRRQTSSGAEVCGQWSSLSTGQFWWKICVEGSKIQSHGCDELSDGEERIQDAGSSSTEISAQC